MKSSDVCSMFPTLVWECHLSDETRDAIRTQVLETIDSQRRRGSGTASASSWQSGPDLHHLAPFAPLCSCIQALAQRVLECLKVSHDGVQITGCWVNVNPPGAEHKVHSHPNNYLSGVHYVQVTDGADTINFHDPRLHTGIIRPPVTGLSSANTDQVVVRVQNGTSLMFPSWLLHSVDANRNPDDRISISYNLMFSAYTSSMSKPLW